MKLVSRLAVAAALAVAPASLLNAQAMPAAVGKPLQEAAKAAAAGNSGKAIAAVQQARAAATTAEQREKVGQMAGYVYTRAGQYGRAAAELEAVGAPAGQLAPLYYQAGQFDKAIAAGRKAGGQGLVVAGQSYIRQGKYPQALGIYQQLVKSNPGNQRYLENLAAAQFKTGNKSAYLATTEKLIRFDPSPSRWKALLLDLKQQQMSRESKLALFHLMNATGAISSADDFQEFAKLAIVGNQPGAAKSALDAAKAANAIASNDQMTLRLLQAAGQKAAEASAALAKLPNTPAGRYQAGNIMLGGGNFAGAITAYNAAISGKESPDQATVFKGIAQVRSGQAGAARATFKSVPEGGMKDIASLWALYASTKG